ncbi:MAG TPA: hypothetical protein VGD08_19340 [Stellaceae bacterium]|jgi:hypothetical protein
MVTDPGFFTPRWDVAADELDAPRTALAAAATAALAAQHDRHAKAADALRLLREACFAVPPKALVGLTFPIGSDAMIESLAEPCRNWLPFAESLGVADVRLLLVGLATPACRDVLDRFS